MPARNRLLSLFSSLLALLNRILAWLDFVVHYMSNYMLYFIFNGLKPQRHTTPSPLKGYAPSVVVTGASEGIGLATSLYLATKGYTVFATVPNANEVHKVCDAVSASESATHLPPNAIHTLVMDVLSPESISHCVEEISSRIGSDPQRQLVGVVNNAGYCMISPMEATPLSDVRKIFELDFFAYISVIHAFMPIIKKNKGRFVNIGSVGGFFNPPMWAPYSALKAAIEGMTRSWRLELMPFGVGMTTIRPGFTRSGGIGGKIQNAVEGYYDGLNGHRDGEKNGTGQVPVGVDSFGRLVKSEMPLGEAEEKVYRPMLDQWFKSVMVAADGGAQDAQAVAKTVHDAMSDRFLMPYYTVGTSALLGQMVRDLCPGSVYEFAVAKSFGCL
ncbi:hypothetical protein V8F06_001561 [Rhypophila decipiens]